MVEIADLRILTTIGRWPRSCGARFSCGKAKKSVARGGDSKNFP